MRADLLAVAAQDLEERLIWEPRSPWSPFRMDAKSRGGEQSQPILRAPKDPDPRLVDATVLRSNLVRTGYPARIIHDKSLAFPSGSRLGVYEITAPIGAGGMGEVYRARDPRLGRDVAIKVLPSAFSADIDRLHRFEQEARAAAALNHPNILAVYDIGTDGGAPFIVSELLEGETLRERARSGPVAVRKVTEYALQIARGLTAAHEKGITHRDLKPENVFVTRDNRVKILDFGLAKLTQDQSALATLSAAATVPAPTHPGVLLGTVGYMAPEQVRGLPVDQRADLFAFGAILYELLSGVRAFSRETVPETMAAILNLDPPDLSAAAAALPPGLVRIVSRCLEKNPSDRFQTASDLAFALDSLSNASGVSTTTPAVTRRRVQQVWLGWAAAALLLAALAPVAYQHIRERPVPPSPMRFQISPIVEFGGQGSFGLSSDGRHLAFAGLGSDGIARLWIRAMDSLEVRPLPGSETVGPAGTALFGRLTDSSSRSTLAGSSRSWMCRAVCRKPCAICRLAVSRWAARGTVTATSSSGTSGVCCASARRAAPQFQSRRSIRRGRRNSICFRHFFPTAVISCTCVSRRAPLN